MPDNTQPTSNFAPLPDESAAGNTGTTSVTQSQGTTAAVTKIEIKKEDIERLGIPADWIAKDPGLIDLVLKSESMKDDERKYWFQLLPVMSEEQVKKLRDILQNERDQLAALDAKYEAEVKKLNEKHLNAWNEEAARKQREERERAEQAHATQDEKKTEDILGQIESL